MTDLSQIPQPPTSPVIPTETAPPAPAEKLPAFSLGTIRQDVPIETYINRNDMPTPTFALGKDIETGEKTGELHAIIPLQLIDRAAEDGKWIHLDGLGGSPWYLAAVVYSKTGSGSPVLVRCGEDDFSRPFEPYGQDGFMRVRAFALARIDDGTLWRPKTPTTTQALPPAATPPVAIGAPA